MNAEEKVAVHIVALVMFIEVIIVGDTEVEMMTGTLQNGEAAAKDEITEEIIDGEWG